MAIERVGVRVRSGTAALLGAYGRAVLTVAEVVAGEQTVHRMLPARPSEPAISAGVDARTMDIGELRRLALSATLSAATDPTRPAYDRLTASTTNLSEWAAGRLLSEAERMRQAAVAVVGSGSGEGRLITRRQFDLALRRQFPWADDLVAARLFDHGVLLAHRIRADVPAPQPEPAASRGLFGGLVDRLRARG